MPCTGCAARTENLPRIDDYETRGSRYSPVFNNRFVCTVTVTMIGKIEDKRIVSRLAHLSRDFDSIPLFERFERLSVLGFSLSSLDAELEWKNGGFLWRYIGVSNNKSRAKLVSCCARFIDFLLYYFSDFTTVNKNGRNLIMRINYGAEFGPKFRDCWKLCVV